MTVLGLTHVAVCVACLSLTTGSLHTSHSSTFNFNSERCFTPLKIKA